MNLICKFIFCINLVFVLVGCKEKKTKEFKEIRDTLKISNGNNIIYEKIGDRISVIQLIENNQRKRTYEFYDTGNLMEVRDYYHDKIIRIQDFFNTENNCTKVISSFVFNHTINSHIAIDRKVYDSCGAINSLKSIYIDVKSSTGRDTFNLGDKAKIIFKWRNPNAYQKEFEKRILIDGFDNEFNIVDEDQIRIYNVKGNEFQDNLTIDKLGNNVIRGVLAEKVIVNEKTFKTNPLFFEYHYYIKKKKIIPANTIEYFDFFNKQFK